MVSMLVPVCFDNPPMAIRPVLSMPFPLPENGALPRSTESHSRQGGASEDREEEIAEQVRLVMGQMLQYVDQLRARYKTSASSATHRPTSSTLSLLWP